MSNSLPVHHMNPTVDASFWYQSMQRNAFLPSNLSTRRITEHASFSFSFDCLYFPASSSHFHQTGFRLYFHQPLSLLHARQNWLQQLEADCYYLHSIYSILKFLTQFKTFWCFLLQLWFVLHQSFWVWTTIQILHFHHLEFLPYQVFWLVQRLH